MLLSPDREERRHLLRQFYRLIDSFEPDNIQVALAMMQGNRPLRQAFEQRYYPLLREFSPQLGEGIARLLLRISNLLQNCNNNEQTLRALLNFYQQHHKADAAWQTLRNYLAEETMYTVSDSLLLRLILLDESPRIAQQITRIELTEESALPPSAGEAVQLAARLQNLEIIRLEKCPAWWAFLAPILPWLPNYNSLSLNKMPQNDLLPDCLSQIKRNYTLTLNDCPNFCQLPAFLYHKNSCIISLSLQNCPITHIAADLFCAPELVELHLYNLPLHDLPTLEKEQVSNISILEFVNLPVADFPPVILQLPKLKTLALRKIAIQKLPPVSAPALKHWENLILEDNGLQDITDWFCALPKLDCLFFLNSLKYVAPCFYKSSVQILRLRRSFVSADLCMDIAERLGWGVNLSFD